MIAGYSITDTISQTVNATVYKAIRLSDGIEVAIKVLAEGISTPARINRFKNEYKIQKSIQSCYVIDVYEMISFGNSWGIVMELGPATLKSQMTVNRSLEAALPMALQLCHALVAIQATGVVFKDLNPGNVLYDTETKQLKVIDFGIASQLITDDDEPLLGLEGTIEYISPEQTGRMNRQVDYRSDFYSLGVIFYQLFCAGKFPFRAEDSLAWIHCHISQIPTRADVENPYVPEVLADIIATLLAKDPQDRYQSIYGLIYDLESCYSMLIKNGAISNFPIKTKDNLGVFSIPTKLFGRDQILSKLQAALMLAINEDTVRLVVLTGYPGSGKSTVVQQLSQDYARRDVISVSGKFEEFRRGQSYAAISQAMSQLTAAVLRLDANPLRAIRRSLASSVGDNVQLVVEVAPALAKLFETIPPAPASEITTLKARVTQAFRAVMKVLASKEHPLILFLDDLQWSDQGTLDLLEDWMSCKEISNILLIASYRENEINTSHTLATFLTKMKEKATFLVLEPLDFKTVEEYVAQSLGGQLLPDLVQIIYEKTHGNPLFMQRMLKYIYKERLLKFDPTSKNWTFSREEVLALHISDNVVEFLLKDMQALKTSDRQVLTLAAFLGASFSAKLLGEISGLLNPQVERSLASLKQREYILATNQPGAYRFQHERIKESAYLMVPITEQARLHYHVGTKMLAVFSEEEIQQRAHELVVHFNKGQDCADSDEARKRLVRLNYIAGSKCVEASNFVAAIEHFDMAIAHMVPKDWEDNPKGTYDLYCQATRCFYMQNQVARADQLCEEIVNHTLGPFEKAQAIHLKVLAYCYLERNHEAMQFSKQALDLFGIKINLKTSPIKAFLEFVKVSIKIYRLGFHDLEHLPSCESQDDIRLAEVMSGLAFSAYNTSNISLYMYITCHMVHRALRVGMSTQAAFCLANYALIFSAGFRKIKFASRLVSVAVNIAERSGDKLMMGKIFWMYNYLIMPFTHSFADCLIFAKQIADIQNQAGDLRFLLQTRLLYSEIDRSLTLPEIIEVTRKNCEFAKQLNDTGLHLSLGALLGYRRCLAGQSTSYTSLNSDLLVESEYLQKAEGVTVLASYYCYKLAAAVMFEDKTVIDAMLPQAQKKIAGFRGIFVEAFPRLMMVLAQAMKAEQSFGPKRWFYLFMIKSSIDIAKTWNDSYAESYSGIYHLMKAVYAAAKRNYSRAFVFFDTSIAASRKIHDSFYLALAYEWAAKYLLQCGYENMAQQYFSDAIIHYRGYGAEAKAKYVAERYQGLFDESMRTEHTSSNTNSVKTISVTRSVSNTQLDLESVMRATHALSQEIKLSTLLSKVIRITVENVGANKSIFIMYDATENDFFIEAEQGENGCKVLQHERMEGVSRFSKSVVNQVLNSHEMIIASDATKDKRFSHDSFVQESLAKSILCVPILKQDELMGVLYLENSLADNAFTKHHGRIVQLLSSQIAVSVENSKLYENLESKIAQRTKELQAKTNDIQAMLTNLKQGIFTILPDLTIHSQYSAYLERIFDQSELAGKRAIDFLFGLTKESGDMISMVSTIIDLAFGQDIIQFQMNSHNLPRALDLYLGKNILNLEVAWEAICDEHNIVEKVMVIIKDMTEVNQLKAESEKQKKEIDVIYQIMKNGELAFEAVDAIRGMALELRRDAEHLGKGKSIRAAMVQCHTMKGVARTYAMVGLVDEIHNFESHLKAVLYNDAHWDEKVLKRLLVTIDETVKHYDKYMKRVYHQRADYSKTLTALIKEVEPVLETTSIEVGKAVPRIYLCDEIGELQDHEASALKKALIHLLTNSVVHGLEDNKLREVAGKAERGSVFIEGLIVDGKRHILLSDDGHGLNLQALADKDSGIGERDEQIAELIFVSGVSTAAEVTKSAGRGVGMDAVRQFIEDIGGSIVIEFTGERKGDFRPFCFRIVV